MESVDELINTPLGWVMGFVGFLACIGAFIVALYYLFDAVKCLTHELGWKHRYKHRFDKPPTAKCYCRDCRWHGSNGKCGLPGITRYTPDNGYCYESEPLTYEEETRKCQDT